MSRKTNLYGMNIKESSPRGAATVGERPKTKTEKKNKPWKSARNLQAWLNFCESLRCSLVVNTISRLVSFDTVSSEYV